MKIRKLKIRNYKVFDDVEFDFTDSDGKTLDVVVLAGVNGCGKTTVLEVLKRIFTRDFSPTPDFQIQFDLSIQERQPIISQIPPISDNHQFIQNIHRNNLSFSTLDRISITNFIRFAYMPSESVDIVYFPVFEKGESHEDFKNIKILHIDRQRTEFKETALKQIRDEVFKNKNKPPQEIIERQIQNITHSLEGMGLNTRLVDLESEELVFESANGKRIYFEQLSHGEQHLYFRAIYLSFLNITNGIILIDEPEAAFHPTWQQNIAKLYRNVGENNQVFMATHSPHIMASVPPESLFVLHIDESGGARRIKVVNMAKAGKHSHGLEPNRILKEVMQVDTLRDYETQRDIERLAELLTLEDFESEEAKNLAKNLTAQLGRQDPFIIRLEHQLLVLRRKKDEPEMA